VQTEVAVLVKLGPCLRKWNLLKIQEEWLEQNLIVDPIDIEFLKDTVASQKEVAKAAQIENDADNACLGAKN
jgi:hypothetical protein